MSDSIQQFKNNMNLGQQTSHKHSYPDIYDPAAPYPLYKIHPLFTEGQLTNSTGQNVSWEDLKGKTVALYFADDCKAKCKSFLPILVNTYRTLNEAGDSQKVEIVFVSLDASQEGYLSHRKRQPWLSLPFNDPLIEQFKQHFRVMHPYELPKYDSPFLITGYGPRMGTPALLIIASNGKLLQQLDINEEGSSLLRKWDINSNPF